MELLLFYLTDDRRHYTFPHFIQMLNSSNRKKSWKLLILTHSNDSQFYIDCMKEYDILFEIRQVPSNNNYLTKVNYACSYAEHYSISYIMKCDNDIFIKSQTLDYMIDSLHLLENDHHLTIGPVLTSGIPGVEYFKDEFLDDASKEIIDSLFLKTQFYDRDGASYNILNKHTGSATKWDKNKYFESVKEMPHYYKGIHPIRINEESLHFLNSYIINNKDRFMQPHELSIIDNDSSAYLCNSVFCIKTDTYKKILFDKTLFVDDFDEVPLNKYAWKHNMNHLFVKNGFAIHMYYNWKPNHINYEKMFVNSFFK